MKQLLKNTLNQLPYIRSLHKKLEQYQHRYPNGHFYSSVPHLEEVDAYSDRIFNRERPSVPGIDLNEDYQKKLLLDNLALLQEFDFPKDQEPGHLYHYDNQNFTLADALSLFLLVRVFNPKRIVEIGSGYSSALMHEINQQYGREQMELNFVEPYPVILRDLLPQEAISSLIEKKIQDVDLDRFTSLEENDMLFIDSSHVYKAASDAQFIYTEIVPRVKKGVLIHIHDIHYPFEYPESWISQKRRAWNENYIVQSFLQFNEHFKIVLWPHFLQSRHPSFLKENAPRFLDYAGGSIWLQRVK